MRWPALLVLAVFALTPLCVEAQLSAAWRNWQYVRPITMEPPAGPALARVTLPMDIFGPARERLADLRVIDGTGTEVPYVLSARSGSRRREWRNATLSEVGFVPTKFTQAVVDAGGSRALHNLLEIRVEEKEFFAWVEVAASDDLRVWRVVRARAPVFRLQEEGRQDGQTVSYPQTRARWLRLRLLDGTTRVSVRHARVAYEVIEEAERVPLPEPLGRDQESPPRESRWQVDLKTAHLPVSAVRFETARPEFHRPVRVRTSLDGKSWQDVCCGEIYRYHIEAGLDGSPRLQEALRVEFSEAWGRYWRVAVLNRNDAPIADLVPILEGVPRHVVFRHTPGNSYHLLYGNSRAEAPQYDLARLTSRTALDRAAAGRLGPEEANSAYVSPEPWTERHPVLLWAVLGLTVGVLGFLAMRSLR